MEGGFDSCKKRKLLIKANMKLVGLEDHSFETGNESNSITNQKAMLVKYAADNGFDNIRLFIDDGVSGTVFSRPALNDLLNEVKAGRVGAIIFKDQSRLGRDVVEVGLLTRTFDEHNVRFIAAADGVDSINGFDIMATFRDVINEYYVAETSKKQRAAKRTSALQGKVMSYPPYGYTIGDDKTVWIVDEYAAGIISTIFNKYIAGETFAEIIRYLDKNNVLMPRFYTQSKKGIYINKTVWSEGTITRILDNSAYIGTYIAGKYTTPSYKNHKAFIRPKDEWVVIENHHSPLIEHAVFETAQRLRKTRRKVTKSGDIGMLGGLIYCADCDFKMTRCINRGYDYFICSHYRKMRGFSADCTRHGIRREEIEELVFMKIRETIALTSSEKSEFIMRVNANLNNDVDKMLKIKTEELTKTRNRIAELDIIISRIYEDRVAGLIDEDRFTKMLCGYEDEQSKLTVSVETLLAEIDNAKSKTADVQSFLNQVKQYGEMTELTAELARTFISKIVVHESVRENPKNVRSSPKTHEVYIYLSYNGEFE